MEPTGGTKVPPYPPPFREPTVLENFVFNCDEVATRTPPLFISPKRRG